MLDALGERVLSIEHVGSTSVPGLWAKPVIDVDVTVADSGDEASYLPDLEAARLRADGPRAGVAAAPLPARTGLPPPTCTSGRRGPSSRSGIVAFRDWLLGHEDDRAAYGDLKARLAEQGFTDVMDYNNAKGGFIYDIYERIFAADPSAPAHAAAAW